MALVAGQIVVIVLAGLAGWLSFRVYEDHEAEERRELFVQAAREVAVDLTTIDYAHPDADVQRIVDSATGSFANSFSTHWWPILERSKLVGTVSDVGLESQTGDVGRVLVAMTVRASKPAQAQQEPQLWRMRVTVQKVGDRGKISAVAPVS